MGSGGGGGGGIQLTTKLDLWFTLSICDFCYICLVIVRFLILKVMKGGILSDTRTPIVLSELSILF